MLYFDAKQKRVHALNGSGRSPGNLTVDRVLQDCPEAKCTMKIPMTHAHAITVPGAVAGWVDAMDKWGSLSLEQVLEPAIELATEGFPVSTITAYQWDRNSWQLRSGPHGDELLIDGRAPRSGEIFTNPGLARCLKEIATHGKKGFYEGPIADEIVKIAQASGSVLTASDVQAHTSTFPKPISVNFNGVDVYEVPPNGQGITALIALNILSEVFRDPSTIPPHNSDEYLHCLVEALRLAFADTKWYVSDPDFHNIPMEELLSKSYAKSRAALIDRAQAMSSPERGEPVTGSDTVSFQVIDGYGNAISMVNSNYANFGTGLIPKGCGFTLQNRGGNFSLQHDHPNVLAPNKRPYHTIIPGMALRDGELYLSFTVMGGFMQPQGHVQILMNLLLYTMSPQAALDSPRFCIGSAHTGTFDGVSVEDSMEKDAVEGLRRKGHQVAVVSGHERSLFGRGQIIKQEHASRVLMAGSDGRADGCAMGW